jgi:hypothetical protein
MRRSAAALATILVALAGVAMPAGTASAATPRVFLLGDSVMAGLNFSTAARALLDASYDVSLDAKVCRTLREPSCSTRYDGQPAAAVTVMRNNAGALGDVLVVMAGYNDGNLGPGLDAVMAEAEAQHVPHVVWLTYRNTTGRYTNSNAVLDEAAAHHRTMVVADWDAYSTGHGDWFGGDGLHLTGAGAMGLATFLKANVDAVLSGKIVRAGGRCAGDVSGTPATAGTATAARVAPASGFVALPPTRAADTRSGDPLGAGHAVDVDLSTIVPAGASAAVVNLTAVDPCGAGFLTAYACGTAVPLASNVNYDRGSTRANLAVVVLGQERHLCVYTYATADVIVDVSGWLAPGQGWRYQALTPSRLVDTRDGFRASAGVVGKRAGGATLPVTVTPWPEAPTSPAAVLVNITAVGADEPGYVTVSACGDGGAAPVSTLNVERGETVANLAASAVAGDGTVCVYTSTAMHVVVDLEGWFGSTGSLLAPQTPQRVVDTRAGTGGSRLTAGATLTVPSTTGAIVNVTAAGPAAAGYLTVHPCGATPWVSNANYGAGDVVPALAAVGTAGAGFCITSPAATDVVVDRLATLVNS